MYKSSILKINGGFYINKLLNLDTYTVLIIKDMSELMKKGKKAETIIRGL